MKLTLLSTTLFPTLGFLSVHAATPEEEAWFTASVKKAFETHDSAALLTLTCWDRVTGEIKELRSKEFTDAAKYKLTDATLTAPDPKFPDMDYKMGGVTMHENLPVTKHLKLTFEPTKSSTGAQSSSSAVYPVGEKDGKLFLTCSAPK